jgi:hypothetical protein
MKRNQIQSFRVNTQTNSNERANKTIRMKRYEITRMKRNDIIERNQIQGFRVNIQANSKSKPFISSLMVPRNPVCGS